MSSMLTFKTDGDWHASANAEWSLIARPTRRAGTKVDLSDPTILSERVVAQQIKVMIFNEMVIMNIYVLGHVVLSLIMRRSRGCT